MFKIGLGVLAVAMMEAGAGAEPVRRAERPLQLAAHHSDEVVDLSKWLWNNPELSDQEFKAVSREVELLRRHGFSVTTPYCGMATAYRAEFASGGGHPAFAFCAEYDALPDVGHACGHNLNSGAALEAALLVKMRLEREGLDGKVILFGCPAEETRGGKIDMAEGGAVEGVDAMMMAHAVPGKRAIRDTGYSGMRTVTVTYRGKGGSPAARYASPTIRNALDAQTLLYEAVALRRHYDPIEVAVSGTITKAGDRANMVPTETVSSYTIRSQNLGLITEAARRFRRMAEGAAMLADVELDYKEDDRYKPTNPCFSLSAVYMEEMAARGIGGENIREKQPNFAATDFGNFSQLRPAVHVHFPVGASAAVHSREFALLCNQPMAYANMQKCAAAMAATALRYLRDADFRGEVAEEFLPGRGGAAEHWSDRPCQ